MALKKKSSGGGGANWMDTYGDMVTLLLCFFVLLYSMSTISEDNWKAIVQSFNPSAVLTPTATTGAGGPDADNDGTTGQMPVEEMQEQVEQDMASLLQQIQEFVQQENLQDAVTVSQDGGKIFVTFSQSVFFGGDSSVILKEAYPVLDSMCEMLSSVAESLDEVRIQGHTARAGTGPNGVIKDRTLASERATNVVMYIQQHSDVPPSCLVSEGFGEWRPVAPNDTAENRAKNRRVEMIISGRDIEAEMEEQGGIQQYIVMTA
ncbi:MAG: flagellar motor protein MotB [Oscillibacter sp.]|nr:flagellar motor protein MotB [uncultured Oscillibacter sp.]MCI8971699.1 flagellar motor protein MotB [Oscillibacter sp.]